MRKTELGRDDVEQQIVDKVLTVPNVISFFRLCMVPLFLILLGKGYNLAATLVFAISAATDFLDGRIARHTHSVSRVGQLLDPAVDRILMIAGVLGLFFVGRLPFWILLVVIVRDAYLLIGGSYLISRRNIRVAVIYPGKFATTLLFVGFAGLLLNWPLISGIGCVTCTWLPGLNDTPCSWGIWFVYAGLALTLFTTIYYSFAAYGALKKARRNT